MNWIAVTFPLFTNDDIAKLLFYYPSTNDSTDRNATTYATNGYTLPSALNVSSFATGQQQRAYVRSPHRRAKSYNRLPLLIEHLRRVNLRLSGLLADRSLHRPGPHRLSLPILGPCCEPRHRFDRHFRVAEGEPAADL